MTTTGNLHGQHAWVTGGGSGIGYAIAEALLRDGAKVTISGRRGDALASAVERLSTLHKGDIASEIADVTDSAQVMSAAQNARQRFGQISILINNAGSAHSAKFTDTAPADFEAMYAVHVLGAVHTMQAVLGDMQELQQGRIINICSTAAIKPYKTISAYGAAKHALLGLTKTVALEYASTGITVNAVCPGYTATVIAEQALENLMQAKQLTRNQAQAILAAANPQGRLIQPEEVAETVRWLCQPSQKTHTGQVFPVCGAEWIG